MSGLFQQIDFLLFNHLCTKELYTIFNIGAHFVEAWSIHKLAARKRNGSDYNKLYFTTRNKEKKEKKTSTNRQQKPNNHHSNDWFFPQSNRILNRQCDAYAVTSLTLDSCCKTIQLKFIKLKKYWDGGKIVCHPINGCHCEGIGFYVDFFFFSRIRYEAAVICRRRAILLHHFLVFNSITLLTVRRPTIKFQIKSIFENKNRNKQKNPWIIQTV